MDLVCESPDGVHCAEFTYAGEIRFGPEYYTLALDSTNFQRRVFGHGAIWSPDSQILVVTEWHSIDYSIGPITSLLLLRPGDRACYSFPRINKGFARANHFIGDSLVLRHSDETFTGGHFTTERETDLSQITEWQPREVRGNIDV